ncbi:hypothetical protein CNY89_27720, partial [Amaricoccus sp. HAR-UPW-R2A-40]
GTFLDKTGQPCREYELLDPEAMALTQGVACRSGDGEWQTEVSVASRMDPVAETPQRITLVGTFLDKTGQPCREYELLDPEAMALTQGVACRSG